MLKLWLLLECGVVVATMPRELELRTCIAVFILFLSQQICKMQQWNPRFVGRSRVITTRQTRQCHLEDHVVGSRQAVDEDEVRPEMSDPAQPSPTQPNPARPKDPRFTCRYLEKLLVLDQWLHILHWFKQANHTKWTNHNQQLWQAVILSVIPLIIRCPLSGLVISGDIILQGLKHFACSWNTQNTWHTIESNNGGKPAGSSCIPIELLHYPKCHTLLVAWYPPS